MHEYIVHIIRKDLRDWGLDVSIPGERTRAYTFLNSEDVYVKGNLDQEPQKMETWYCLDEISAAKLAMHLAAKCPGSSVGVYKVTHIARTPAVAPVLSAFTEKGLMPE